MSWNATANQNRSRRPAERQAATAPAPAWRKAALAGLIVVALGGAVVWFMSQPVAKPAVVSERPKSQGTIAEVKPAPAATNVPVVVDGSNVQVGVSTVVTVKAPEDQKLPQTQLAVHVHTSKIVTARGNYEVFKHRAENMLAALVCAPVGTQIVGAPNFDEGFMQDLANSFADKIEILPEDDEQTRYYKESVIAAKNEIREMLKSGVDIREELIRTRKELQDLGVYKKSLDDEIARMQRDSDNNLSEADVEDLIKAANQMLEAKGIAPFEFNKLTKTIIRRKPFPTPEDTAADDAALKDNDE